MVQTDPDDGQILRVVSISDFLILKIALSTILRTAVQFDKTLKQGYISTKTLLIYRGI